MKVLLVEDNITLSKSLKYNLEQNNFIVDSSSSISSSNEYLSNNTPDIIILDINLTDGSGFNLYKDTIKNKSIPTIFLTARDDEDDIVHGLELGAEDYITKPFSTKELIARINKIIMRNKKETSITIDNIKYNLDKMELYKDDELIELSSLELKIVNLLFNNINKAVSRNEILDKIWEWTGNDVDDHTVTVYIKRIKDKIGADIIKTIKGIGYRIDE